MPRLNHRWRDRIYTPWITLGIFLSQVLSADHSCDDAVDRFQKCRNDQGLPKVATDTSSYCEARERLPETSSGIWSDGRGDRFIKRPSILAVSWTIRQDRRRLHCHHAGHQGTRRSTLRRSQKPGLGFPIARILVVFSLAVGTVLEAAVGPYQGKETSELALLRQISGQFQPGDIALADRFFCSYWVIAALQAPRRRCRFAAASVSQGRLPPRTSARPGRPHRHLAEAPADPDWMSRAEYAAMPAELTIRELRVRVKDKTKRARDLVIVTTLLDARKYPAKHWAICSVSGGTRNSIYDR